MKSAGGDRWINLAFPRKGRPILEMMSVDIKEGLLGLRPQKSATCEVAKNTDDTGSDYYVVRNTANNRYIKLDSPYYNFFNKMDGNISISEMIDTTFTVPERPDTETVFQFLSLLYRTGLALPKSEFEKKAFDIDLSGDEEITSTSSLLSRIGQKILKSRIEFGNADGLITKLYNGGGKIFFSKISLSLMILVTLIGWVLLSAQITRWQFTVNKPSPATILPVAYIGLAIAILLHELAHALTCKHFGRKVFSLGFMIYYGFPAFFTDTTDSWMLSRGKRVAVDVAGVAMNAVLGGICGILAFLLGGHYWSLIFMVAAGMNFMAVFMNLIPFLKYDGYYIAADWLDRPNLREDAIMLLFNSQSWKEIIYQRYLPKEKIGTLIFGLLSVLYGVGLIALLLIMIFRAIYEKLPAPYNLTVLFVIGATVISSLFSYLRQEWKTVNGFCR